MKCVKCGFECDDGAKFCDECGAELPQVKSCPKCHAQLSAAARFCDACGYDFSNKQKDGEVAISMGDKNVVAGDVVAHKESFKISGNATIVRNDDASKKMVQCTICGKNIPISESFECQDCHQIVCEECFDKTAKKCKKCEGAGQGENEATYRAAIAEALSDGKIDVSDRKKLMALQKQLGISVAKAVQIEKEMKPASGGGESKNSAAFDKANTDKAYQLLYIKGDYKKAAELMAPVCERHPEDENALAIYLAALTRFNPVKAKTVVAGLHADVLCGMLALIDIDIKHKDFPSAEKRIATALGLWPDSALLKCRKVVYAYELFMVTEDSAPLMEASEIIDSIDAKEDAVVKSWKYYAKRIIDSALGEEVQRLDRAQCDKDGLLWDVVSSGEDKSSSLYRIIDVSAGPDAKFYPTYYMDTESTNNWPDEFKTDLIALRKIAPGTFRMGHGKNEWPSYDTTDYYEPQNANPEHDVTLSRAYYIGVFPVTQRQWELMTGSRPSRFSADEHYAARPADNVSYADIRGKSVGLKWPNTFKVDSNSALGILRKKTGISGLDLPTEAQWECACRAGSGSDYYSGENVSEDAGENMVVLRNIGRFNANHYADVEGEDDPRAKCDGKKTGTAKVGSYAPNAWGLYDFIGNISEWCLDPSWGLSGEAPTDRRGIYRIDEHHVVDPIGWGGDELTELTSYTERVIRGGNWSDDDPTHLTSWARSGQSPDSNYRNDIGFRLVINTTNQISETFKGSSLSCISNATEDDVGALTLCAEIGDLNAELALAKCKYLGTGGIAQNKTEAIDDIKKLIGRGLITAIGTLADVKVREWKVSKDQSTLNEIVSLLREASSCKDAPSICLYKDLFKGGEPFLTTLAALCGSVKTDRHSDFVVLTGAKLEEKMDVLKEGMIKHLDWTDDMLPKKPIAAFISCNCTGGEYTDDVITGNANSHFQIVADDGLYILSGASWGNAQYRVGFITWDEFIEKGDVKQIGYEDQYIQLLKDSMIMEVPCGDVKKVKLYQDILDCARSLYKGPIGGSSCKQDNPLEKWGGFPIPDLKNLTSDQYAELDALSGAKNSDVELRKAICLENGYGCGIPNVTKAVEAYKNASLWGNADAPKMLVKLAAKGKEGFADAIEKICIEYRKSVEEEIINKCKEDPSFAAKGERARQFLLKVALADLDQIIIVGHDALSGLIDGVMREFAKGVEHGSSYAPAKPLALIPIPKRDQTHGLVVATEGIYIVNDDVRRRPNAYLSWEELAEHAVLKIDSKRKFDFVITDKPERVVLSVVGMHLNEEALRTMLNGLIEYAKKGFDSYGEDPAQQSAKPELNAQQSEPAKPQQISSQAKVSASRSCQNPTGNKTTNPVTRTGDTSSAKASSNGTAKIAHRCKLEISQVLVKTGFKKFATLESLQKADRSMLRDPSKFKNYDESFALDAATIKVFVDGRQILCEELDPDNDKTAIAYEDDGELFTDGLDVEGDEVLLFVQRSCKRTRLSEFEIAGDFVPAKLKIVYRTFSHTSEDDLRVIWSLRYDGKNVGRKFVGDAADSDKKSWIESEDEYGEFDVWSKPVSENLPSASTPSASENAAEPKEAEPNDEASSCDGHVSDRKRILFFIIGILFGFLGFHFKYAHRRILFHLTWLLLVATGVSMAMKKEMVGAGLGVVWFILWIGCAFFMKKDGNGRKMNWFKSK